MRLARATSGGQYVKEVMKELFFCSCWVFLRFFYYDVDCCASAEQIDTNDPGVLGSIGVE